MLSNSFSKRQHLVELKFKAFASHKLKMVKMSKLIIDQVENTVEKEENDGYQHFLLFPQSFKSLLFQGS